MKDERRTPRWLFDSINREFNFTLDAAATSENALVPCHFTLAQNSLQQDWSSHRVWCNPPYSQDCIKKWVNKALRSRQALTVMLVPGDSSTKASQRMLYNATAILFLNERLKFDNEPSGAKFANWLVLFNGTQADVERMRQLDLGFVMVNRTHDAPPPNLISSAPASASRATPSALLHFGTQCSCAVRGPRNFALP
jgi:phage N-6-adenine-methyltransferase